MPTDPNTPLVIDGHRYWLVNGRLRPSWPEVPTSRRLGP